MAIDETPDFRLSAVVDTSRLSGGERRVGFHIELDDVGVQSSSPLDLIFGETSPEDMVRRIEINPRSVNRLRSELDGHIQQITDRLDVGGGASQDATLAIVNNILPVNIPSLGGGTNLSVSIPRPLQNVGSVQVNSMPFVTDERVRFQAVPIPVFPGDRFSVNDLPGLQFDVEAIVRQVDGPSVTIEVPPDIMFQTRDLTDVRSCDQLFPDLFQDVQNLRDQVPSGPITDAGLADQRNIRLSSIGENLPIGQARERLEQAVNDVPVSPCQRDLRSELEGINIQGCADLTDFYSTIDNRMDRLEGRVDQVRSEVSGVDVGGGSVRDTISESDVGSNVTGGTTRRSVLGSLGGQEEEEEDDSATVSGRSGGLDELVFNEFGRVTGFEDDG